MTSTRLNPDASMQARLFAGHDADGERVENWKFGCLAPCGGLYSTANDLLKFLAAGLELRETPLKAAFATALEPRVEVNKQLKMGLNWLLIKDEWASHDGMTGGYASFVAMSKTDKLGIVVLSNTAIGGEGNQLGMFTASLVKSLVEKDPPQLPVVPAATSVKPELLESYVGKYTLVPLVATFTISREDDRLYAQLTGQPLFRIYPESESKFFYKVVKAKITFERDEQGKVERLVLHQNGKDMPAARQRDM
jgi:CubicO group peptidase (beta-lactamase class C family)